MTRPTTRFEDLPDILRVPEAAAFLQVSQTLMRELCRDGRIHALRFGRAVRVPKREVQRIMEDR